MNKFNETAFYLTPVTMNKKIQLFLLGSFLFFGAYAQEAVINDFVNQGIKLHDKGNYTAAVDLYKKALLLNPKSAFANYEIASTYLALKDYQSAIVHSNKVIVANIDYVDQAYILKGTALDKSGKLYEAVAVYKEGIKKFKGNHLLYYNLALSLVNVEDYTQAADALEKSLQLNPAHASSHLFLGNIMSIQQQRIKSILALYNFLLLEPQTNRTTTAYGMLEEQYKKRIKNDTEKSVTITVPAKTKNDEFYTAELMLDLLEAGKTNEANKNKTAMQLFAENTNSLFTILGELKKNKHGFWWDFYVTYFYDMAQKNHTAAFCYYISQKSKPNDYSNYYKTNLPKLELFSEWYTRYDRKPAKK